MRRGRLIVEKVWNLKQAFGLIKPACSEKNNYENAMAVEGYLSTCANKTYILVRWKRKPLALWKADRELKMFSTLILIQRIDEWVESSGEW